MRAIVWALVLLLAAPTLARAGAELATETRSAEGRLRRSKALFDGRRVRIDTRDGRRSMVYRGARRLIWIIDHEKQNYVEVEIPTPQELAGELQARKQALPPEQRAALDGLAVVDPRIELRRTQETSRVAGITCQQYHVLQAEQRVADVCSASYEAAGVSRSSFEALRDLQSLLQGSLAALVSDDLREDGIAALESFGQLEGVPMRVRAYEAGRLDSETLVTHIESRSIAAGDFEIPEGYRPKISISIRQ